MGGKGREAKGREGKGRAGQGRAWHGMAWHGMAWDGLTGIQRDAKRCGVMRYHKKAESVHTRAIKAPLPGLGAAPSQPVTQRDPAWPGPAWPGLLCLACSAPLACLHKNHATDNNRRTGKHIITNNNE